jgi:hypothetical protein
MGTLMSTLSTAALRIYRDATHLQRLQAIAVLAYLCVFLAFMVAGPGFGISQGFYVPIILVALGGTALTGVAAGLVATALYATVMVHADGRDDLLSASMGVHLAMYVLAGVLIGYLATRGRTMLTDALHLLEDLLDLARRDLATGLLDQHGLDRAVAERIAGGVPFTLLVGAIESADDDEAELRRASLTLLGELEPGAEVARIGPAHFAVVTAPASVHAARALADALERAIALDGGRATFGWTVYPTEGAEVWALFRAASERLYARRIVRGEWSPTAVSAGLVEELPVRLVAD